MHMNLLHDAKIVRVAASASVAQTEVVSAVVDTQGYESVAFVALLGDVTSGSVLTLTAKTNSANSTSNATATEAKVTFTAGASDADSKMLMVDCHQPRERYAFASLTRTTANAVVDGIVAVLYNGSERPEGGVDASMIAAALFADPAPAA